MVILEERLWDDQDSSIISSWEHGCARAMYITFQDIMLIEWGVVGWQWLSQMIQPVT